MEKGLAEQFILGFLKHWHARMHGVGLSRIN